MKNMNQGNKKRRDESSSSSEESDRNEDESSSSSTCPKLVRAKKKVHLKHWTKYPTQTLDCLNIDSKNLNEPGRSQYGGRLDLQEKATGFFHVKQIDNGNGGRRWTLIDPDGYVFISAGVNSVELLKNNKAYQEAFEKQFADAQDWTRQTHDLIISKLSFNTLGCWSNPSAFERKAGIRVPYTPNLRFLTYKKNRPYGPMKKNLGLIPCFDPEFEDFADRHARKSLKDMKDDPWLIGVFSDNELPFKDEDILLRYLTGFEPTDPNHEAAAKFLQDRNKTEDDIMKEDDKAFCALVIGRYYQVVGTAIKKHDPNHLFLGSRFHGKALRRESLFVASAPWVDVISVNYYNRWTPEQERINEWAAMSGRPIIVTEWYAMANDAKGCENKHGAGFLVPKQKDRAFFYQNFTIGLLRNPNVVGWHWFRYIDKGGSNRGVLDMNFHPYHALSNAMQKINSKLYSLSDILQQEPDSSVCLEESEGNG